MTPQLLKSRWQNCKANAQKTGPIASCFTCDLVKVPVIDVSSSSPEREDHDCDEDENEKYNDEHRDHLLSFFVSDFNAGIGMKLEGVTHLSHDSIRGLQDFLRQIADRHLCSSSSHNMRRSCEGAALGYQIRQSLSLDDDFPSEGKASVVVEFSGRSNTDIADQVTGVIIM